MQPIRQDCCYRLMRMYQACVENPRYLVNVDQTAVYLSCSPNCTVDTKVKRTIPIRVGGASSMRFTLCVSIATDGTKLSFFVVLKVEPNGNIEKNFPVSCQPVCLVAHKARRDVTNVLCSSGMIRFGSPTLLTMTVSLDYYWIITRYTLWKF